jgi:diacylglycerol kinase family enzyme
MPTRSDQDRIAIVQNPISGSGYGKRELLRLVEELYRRDCLVDVYSEREELAALLANPANRQHLKCLVVAGGDGSFNDAINRYDDVPFAIFPMGTENLLAKYLKIESSGEMLADLICHGHTEEFDLCELNGRKFLLMTSFGIDAEVVRRTDENRHGNISKLSYVQPFWASIRNYEYPCLNVYVDENPEPYQGCYGIISNIPAYAMQLPFAADANPFDGKLDLRLFEKGSFWSTMEYLYSVSNQRHEVRDDVICLQGTRFRIEADGPVPVQVDGDPAGFTPADVCVGPSKVSLFVPAGFTSENVERISA